MNNAKFALLIAETHRADAKHETSTGWRSLLAGWYSVLPKDEEKHRLTENIWQIPLDSGLPIHARLIQACNDYNVPIRVLFFDEEPEWRKHPAEIAKPA